MAYSTAYLENRRFQRRLENERLKCFRFIAMPRLKPGKVRGGAPRALPSYHTKKWTAKRRQDANARFPVHRKPAKHKWSRPVWSHVDFSKCVLAGS